MWKAVLAIVLAAALAGCVTIPPPPFRAQVVSTVRPEFDRTATHVMAKSGPELDFDVTALAAERMLSAAGLRVLSPDEAPTGNEVLVTVSFVNEKPVTLTYTSREAVYGETGIASSRTVERVNKKGEKVSTTTYEPRIGVIGYEDRVNSSIQYPVRLVLKAYDQTEPALPLWTVVVTMPDASPDRAAVRPLLLKAAQAYVGRSATDVSVEIPQGDPDVAFIRTGIAPPAPKGSRR